MATFPALQPATRTFTPGRHPHSEIPTLSGLQVRVRTSNVLLDQRLRLTFAALTESEMLSIRSHYLGQQGRFLSFVIPNDLLSGTTTPASFTPTGYSWIYADRPRITDIGLQRYDVAVELATVPPEGATLNGAELAVAATLAAGAASVELPALGTVTISFAPGAASATDPSFSSVSLLLHMDGSNGSTTFTDSSSNALTVTRTGNAQISTAQSKFGSASGLFDGTGDWLQTSLPSAIGTGDFTVEAWIYINSLASLAPLCCLGDGLQASGLLLFITTGGRISAFGNNTSIATGSTQTVSTSVWTHIAISRSGSSLKLFVNGINDGTATNSANLSVASTQIGRELYNAATGAQLNGYIDDLRITKGVARYTANFTPPAAAFPNS